MGHCIYKQNKKTMFVTQTISQWLAWIIVMIKVDPFSKGE